MKYVLEFEEKIDLIVLSSIPEEATKKAILPLPIYLVLSTTVYQIQ